MIKTILHGRALLTVQILHSYRFFRLSSMKQCARFWRFDSNPMWGWSQYVLVTQAKLNAFIIGLATEFGRRLLEPCRAAGYTMKHGTNPRGLKVTPTMANFFLNNHRPAFRNNSRDVPCQVRCADTSTTEYPDQAMDPNPIFDRPIVRSTVQPYIYFCCP